MTGPGTGPEFISEPLDEVQHAVNGFRSGEDELDKWLKEFAIHAGLMNTARTFVWVERSHGPAPVLAYYALAAHLIASEDAPKSVARGGPRQLPAILLAKLALSQDLQGRGLGAQLLVDALRRSVAATRQGPAARVVVVDAVHERASHFYGKYGFTAVPGNPLRLIQKMSAIESALSTG